MRFLTIVHLLLVLAVVPSSGSAQERKPLFPSDGSPLPAQAAPAPLPSLSAQACNGCHAEIHDQWSASGHAGASTDPLYRASLRAAGDPVLCRKCHLPLENQWVNLPSGKGKLGETARVANPAHQPTLALEGVTCAACHVRDGVVIGPRELPAERVPHPVRFEPALRGAEACAACHQVTLPGGDEHPFIDTVGEWARSAYAEAGVTCADCHMKRVSGMVAASRHATYASHGMTRDYAPEEVARAVTLELSLRSSTVVRGDSLRSTAVLMNTGAGHAVPTGKPDTTLRLRFDVESPDGEPIEEAEAMVVDLRREMSEEPPFTLVRDDRLPAGGSRAFDYAWTVSKKLAPGPVELVVRLERWAMSEAKAEALGLTVEDVRLLVSEQRIPITIE